MMNLNTRPDRLIVKVVPGADGSSTLYEDEGDTENYKKGVFTTTKLRHEGSTLTIEPRKGSFPGMLSERAYTVEFLSVDRPTSVTVNGVALTNGAWNYNDQTKTVTVFVPMTACDKQLTVSIK